MNTELNKELNDCKSVMSEVFESLFEFGEEYRDKVEGLMAYSVLLTALENAEALDLDLSDIGLTRSAVDGLLKSKPENS